MAKSLNNTTTKQTQIDLTDNTNDSGVQTTDSKAKLVYYKFKEKQNSHSDFLTFLGIFISCLASLLTSDYKNVFGIENSGIFIQSIFFIVCVVSFILSIIYLVRWLKLRKKYNEDTFIKHLKGTENKD